MADYSTYTKAELLKIIAKQEKELKTKKYGLVWDSEREPEQVVLDCENNLPILKRLKSKEIRTDDTDDNILIEGDNYHALTVLNYTHKEQVDVIYIDPPYNNGNKDFIYNDQFIEKEDSYKHSKWLNFMEKRLNLAKVLLKQSGIIFISIDDNEESQIKILCDKIFGELNFIEKIVWNKRIPKNDKGIGNIHEYILIYAKDHSFKHKFKMPKEGIDEVYEFVAKFKKNKIPINKTEIELKKFYKKKGFDRGITLYCNLDENYRLWGKINVSWPNAKNGPRYDVLHPSTNNPTKVPNNGWRYKKETFEAYLDYPNTLKRHDESFVCGQIWFAKNENTQPSFIQYLDNVKDFLFRSIISIKSSGGSELDEIIPKNNFPHPKTYKLIKLLLQSIDNSQAVVLDFMAGSGTTGHAVLQLNSEDEGNRKFILCTNNEGRICHDVTFPRLQKIINGYKKKGVGEQVGGLNGNLQYFKTSLLKKTTNRDQVKINLTQKCTEMLCVKENIFNLEVEGKDFKIFSSNKKGRFLCVYYNFIEDSFNAFVEELQKLESKKNIYMFSMENQIDKSIFSGLKNFTIEAIPQNILDVYKQLVKMNIPVKPNVIFTDLNKAKTKIFVGKDKDEGARILRVVLEKLIQKISQNNSINILNAKGKELKISTLNDSLLNQNIITKIEWAENRTYLTIGNNAAHGDYDDYDIKQIRKFYKHIQSLLNNYNV